MSVILVGEEVLLAPVAALRDVVGYVGNDDPGEAGHGAMAMREGRSRQLGIVSPE